jgi:hypothetical protein
MSSFHVLWGATIKKVNVNKDIDRGKIITDVINKEYSKTNVVIQINDKYIDHINYIKKKIDK